MAINAHYIKYAAFLLNESCNSIVVGPCEDACCPIWETLSEKGKTCPNFCMDLAALGETFARDLNMPRVGDDVILNRDFLTGLAHFKKGEKVRIVKLNPITGYSILHVTENPDELDRLHNCGFDFWAEIIRNKYTKEIIKTLQEA